MEFVSEFTDSKKHKCKPVVGKIPKSTGREYKPHSNTGQTIKDGAEGRT